MKNKLLFILKKYITPLILSLVLYFVSFSSIKGLSFTTDEPSHLARGVMLIRTWDFRINQHHPYLFNLIEALPIALDKTFKGEDLNSDNWKQAKKDDIAVNLVWLNQGREYYSSVYLIKARQIAAISAAVFLFVLYQIVYKYFGFTRTFISTTLLAFSPTVLAHSSLMTTDIPSMFTIVFAALAMCLDLKRSEKSLKFPIFFTLTAFIAILTKYTATLLLPFWFIFLFYIFVWVKRYDWKKSLLTLTGSLLFILFLLTAAYGFRFQTIYDTDYNNPGKIEATYDHLAMINRVMPIIDISKGLDSLYTKVKVPFPEYIKGFYDNVVKHDIHGHKTYLLGDSFNGGNILYFPVAFMLKETLPFVFISLFTVIYLSVLYKNNRKGFATKYTTYLPLIFTPLVLTALSLASSINIGIRHLLPIYPFLTFGIAYVIVDVYRKYFRNRIYIVCITALICAHLLLALKGYPNYIGYFNEVIGNRDNAYLYLQGSNLDWQQERHLEESNYEEYSKKGLTIYSVEDLSTNLRRLQKWQKCLRYRYFNGDLEPVEKLGHNYVVFKIEDKESLCNF